MASLHEIRLRSLPRLPPTWQLLTEVEQTPWQKAIHECYDLLTGKVFGDVRYKTYVVTAPLKVDGQHGMLGFIASGTGDELAVIPTRTGLCAERKILQNRLLQDHGSITGHSDIWLFYITRSPCVHCGEAIVEGLEKEFFKHIVVAFEGCYQPSDLARAMPGDAFFRRVKRRYNPRDPGIELFKVYRSLEDSAKLAQGELGNYPEERVVYGQDIGGPLLPGRKSRRRKDVGLQDDPLRRETRAVTVFHSEAGDLAVISDETKDPLANYDATLRLLRVTRA